MTSTRTIVGTLRHADGRPLSGAMVGFTMAAGSYTVLPGVTYPQEQQAAVTDSAGYFQISLVSGLGVWMVCHMPDGDGFRFPLNDGLVAGAPVSLETLRAQTGGPMPVTYLPPGPTTVQDVLVIDGDPGENSELDFAADGVVRWRVFRDYANNLLIGTVPDNIFMALRSSDGHVDFTSGFGHGPWGFGIGQSVTQLSSKATAVTFGQYGVCGQIITHGASLAAATSVVFRVNAPQITAYDTVIVAQASGGTPGAYLVGVDKVGTGFFNLFLRNLTAGPLAEALALNVSIIKGVNG